MLLLRELPDGLGITGADLQNNVRLYYKDGMVCDMSLEYTCATCRNWEQKTSSVRPIELGRCHYLPITSRSDFGCTGWEPKA
jgi:hypothetical protein